MTESGDAPSRIRVYSKAHVDALLVDSGAPLPGAVSSASRGPATSRTGMGSVMTSASAASSRLGGGSAASASGTRSRMSPSKSTASKRAQDAKDDRRRKYLVKRAAEEEAARGKLKEQVEVRKRAKDLEFEQRYRRLVGENEVTARIDSTLAHAERQERQKAEGRFNEWEEQVFLPIAKGITESMDSQSHATIAKRRRKDYDNFLKATNQTAGLFLDIVHEDDYNPFEAQKHAVKVKTDPTKDPLKRIIRKTEEEKCMIDPSAIKAIKAQRGGRATLDVKQWHTGKIEATPHGHFAHMMSSHHTPEQLERAQRMTKSRVHMDHYEVPTGADVLRSEYPRGKRTIGQIRDHFASNVPGALPASAAST